MNHMLYQKYVINTLSLLGHILNLSLGPEPGFSTCHQWRHRWAREQMCCLTKLKRGATKWLVGCELGHFWHEATFSWTTSESGVQIIFDSVCEVHDLWWRCDWQICLAPFSSKPGTGKSCKIQTGRGALSLTDPCYRKTVDTRPSVERSQKLKVGVRPNVRRDWTLRPQSSSSSSSGRPIEVLSTRTHLRQKTSIIFEEYAATVATWTKAEKRRTSRWVASAKCGHVCRECFPKQQRTRGALLQLDNWTYLRYILPILHSHCCSPQEPNLRTMTFPKFVIWLHLTSSSWKACIWVKTPAWPTQTSTPSR